MNNLAILSNRTVTGIFMTAILERIINLSSQRTNVSLGCLVMYCGSNKPARASFAGAPTSNNDGDGSDIIPIIGGAVGGVILLLMITVVLCIVILCMRRSYRKKKLSTDDKDFANLNNDVKLDHNPSYVVTTPDTVAYSTVKPRDSSVSITSNPSYYIPLTSNPSYNVHTKPYSEDEYNYVQPNEYNQHSESVEMDTNPSYEVGKDRTTRTVLNATNTKAGHSSHATTTEEYDYAYPQDDHLLHHNTTANTTDDTKITQSPYLTLVSNDAKAHDGSTAK